MIDLFEHEQQILNQATERAENTETIKHEEFAALTKEYGRLLKQLRRSTRIADRTTIDLYEDNIDLSGKVHTDGLTGIYNRRYMETTLIDIINTLSRNEGNKLCVMMLDVDFFKKYNDTYGHAAGDDCLKTVAATLKSSVERKCDFVARYGGEEFAVILQNTDENGAKKVAETILNNIRNKKIPHESSETAPYVTVSLGAAYGIVTHEQTNADYIVCADTALYQSKANGRNQYTFSNLQI